MRLAFDRQNYVLYENEADKTFFIAETFNQEVTWYKSNAVCKFVYKYITSCSKNTGKYMRKILSIFFVQITIQ